jgi:hypothetical protein
MKKNKLQKEFFAELAKVPIVQVACEKTGISRNSVYRWRKEDAIFATRMDEALAEGVAFVSDMSESQLLTLIKEKSYPAISFWLRHRNDKYKARVEVSGSVNTIQELSPDQQVLVRKALALAELDFKEDENQ